MTTLNNLRLFLIESLPDSIERRDLISLIETEISNANGEENALVIRMTIEEAREWIAFKNFRHTVFEQSKPVEKKEATIELVGNIHPELKRLGIKAGDVFTALIDINNIRTARFEIMSSGFRANCSVWPDNYRIITEEKTQTTNNKP